MKQNTLKVNDAAQQATDAAAALHRATILKGVYIGVALCWLAYGFVDLLVLLDVFEAHEASWWMLLAIVGLVPLNFLNGWQTHKRAAEAHRCAMTRLGIEITKVQQRKKKARAAGQAVVLDDFRIVSEEDVPLFVHDRDPNFEEAMTRPLQVVDPFEVPGGDIDAGQF